MRWANGAALAFRRALWRFTLGIKARRRGRLARVTTFLYTALVLSGGMEAQARPTRRVLILNETGTSYPAINTIDQGIRAGLQDAPYRLEFYREYMETVLFPDPETQQEFRAFYLRKYQNRKPDVIITVGPSPLQFMLETHERAFAGVPVIFCLPYGPSPGTLTLDGGITGVANVVEPAATLEVALRLKPETKHVIIVGGTSTLDRQTRSMVQQGLRSYAGRLDISYLTDLTMPALLKRLRHVPSDAIILFSGITQDAAGTPFLGSESAPAVTAAASAPVFVLTDSFLGHGEVGGKLFTRFEQGQVTGNMSLRVLNGEKPQDIPVVNGVTQYMFDWRALKRWGMKESNLPPGSIVLNRQPTVWDLYQWYIIGGIVLLLLQTLLIFGLLRQRAKRRMTESELKLSNDRLRHAVEAGKCVGWDWDVKTGRDCWFGDLHTMFGIQSDTHYGHVEEFRRRIYPEDQELVWKAAIDARESREPFIAEFRVLRLDGTVRWVTERGQFYYAPNGDAVRMLGMAVDITERKLAEESLADVGRKLIEAHEEERTWIARELHDDINQKMALLAIELDRWNQQLPPSAVEFHDHIHHASQRLSDIAADIQALSHRLHSSKLEYLGIVAAVKSFCKELSEQQKVEIDFSHTDMPRSVPKEISLCLFRVLQETLQNAVKHSGTRHFKVELHGAEGEIQLTVSDSGVGFDPQDAMYRRGLGLISMRERIQLVSGQFSIKSHPGSGTTIHARVPFSSSSDSVRAAG